ncbi:hypothetical protein [Roseococcus pinisoli]|uniref:Terminase n=1 Tax=Roseococcus pinisoli TaxID=2835040 RepID=A0ABS5QFA1_9PROT|nr:hypothetical protein [Roseococcus pinisoli]MBS7812374.1 hypothetical protein [Roseococcus pinisoli]
MSRLLIDICRRLKELGEAGEHVLAHAATIAGRVPRAAYLKEAFAHLGRMHSLGWKFVRVPVDVQTFLESPAFLKQKGEIYPKVMAEIIELNSGRYTEAVLTGSIGSGKTTVALYTQAYQLYILSCLKNPQREFGQNNSAELTIVFQSMNAALAKAVDYDRFKTMITLSPYFQRHFRFDKSLKSELHFPNRIIVKPLSGASTAAIGQNVIGGIIDEVNFMEITEASKKSADGGVYNQAVEVYNSIARRRKSRFMRRGALPGMVCLVSSKKYPGEFTEQKSDEAKRELNERGSTTIFVYDKRAWEIKPEDQFSQAWFRLFIGDLSRKPSILTDDEVVPPEDEHLVMRVPEDWRSEFDNDMLSALRDVAGVSVRAMHPYILEPEKVTKCFGVVKSVLSQPWADFRLQWPLIHPKRISQPAEPRYIHLDLGLTGDSCGVSIGHVSHFVEVRRGNAVDAPVECLPFIRFDVVLQVKPPKGGEIHFDKIRQLIYRLREEGMTIRWASADQFQSADNLQIMATQGIITGRLSIDSTSVPYDISKQAFYDGRVACPEQATAMAEWSRLERNPKTGKVDHPANFSKDISDSMAGVIYGLTMRREIWARHKIPPVRLPKSLSDAMAKETAKAQRQEIRHRDIHLTTGTPMEVGV